MLCALCAARQSNCPECRQRYAQHQLRVVYDLIPENDPSTADVKLRRNLEAARETLASRISNAKARLDSLRTLREKVRFQNGDVKAKVTNALDLAIDQLTKLRTQLTGELDEAETENTENSQRLEVALQDMLKDCAQADLRLQGSGSHLEEELLEVQRTVLNLESPHQVAFKGFTVKDGFGADVLTQTATLRGAVVAQQVATTPVAPKKPAFTNKYVPVSKQPERPPVKAVMVEPSQRNAPIVRWFYEYKGTKKAFTPDFTAALEEAYIRGANWCELRDKQQRLIFEVNMRNWQSYRPGDRQHTCAIGRDLI